MTEQEFEPISRLSAWVRDNRHRHTDTFHADMSEVLAMAKECSKWRELLGSDSPEELKLGSPENVRITHNMAKQNDIEELLLSERFLMKFAAAFGNTPIPGASSTECGIRPWCTETGQNACSCHERDCSYVCDYCYAQGQRGHMETMS